MNDALTSFRGMRKEAEENPIDKLNKLDKLDSIDNLQAATELVAETVEQKSNEVVGAVEDNTAANELTAENTQSTAGNTQKTYEELQKLNNFSSQMNEKLRGFGVMMERRFGVVSKMASGIGAIEEALKNPEQPQTMPSPQPVLPTVPEQPNNDNYQGLPKKKPDVDDRKKKNATDKRNADSMENLLKVVRGGFKETIGISNKVLGMLFKITLTAMAEAAKWGAILMGIVFVIDTLMVHFRYWSDLFETKFDDFMDKAGEWAGPISDILTTIRQVRDYWSKGEYGELIKSLVMGIGDAFYKTFIQLDRIITTGIAKILRMIPGMGDYADKLEYGALKSAVAQGYTPNERELELMDKVESEHEEDKYGERTGWTGKARDIGEAIGDSIKDKVNEGLVSLGWRDQKDVDAEKRQEELKRGEYESVSAEQRSASRKLRIKSEGAINNINEVMENLSGDYDKERMGELKKDIDVYREKVQDPTLVESDRSQLERLIEKFDEMYADKTKGVVPTNPVPATETETAKQAERTEQMQKQAAIQQQTTNQTSNVNNTQIVTNNRTIKQGAPTTRIDAPGTINMGNF